MQQPRIFPNALGRRIEPEVMVSRLGLRGEVKVDVVDHRGNVVREGKWQPNLILDRGLNIIATIPICDMFSVCVKGTNDLITTEGPTVSTYFMGSGSTPSNEVTRGGGSRDFTSDDVGKLIKFTGTSLFARLESLTSVTIMVTDRTQLSTPGKTITLFSVKQGWEQVDEDGVTRIPSSTATLTKALGDTEVAASAPVFDAGDVGQAIYFNTTKKAYEITGFTDSQHIDVDCLTDDAQITAETGAIFVFIEDDEALLPISRTSTYSAVSGENGTVTGTGGTANERTFTRTFVFSPELEDKEVVTGTYSRSGTTVTRATGVRDFSADDVGKVMHFGTEGSECVIVTFTNATHVTVDESGTITAQSIDLYSFYTYTEVAFSDESYPGDNINVRVLLDSPAVALGATALNPGQQLKVQYKVKLTVNPETATSANLNSIITDNGAVKMSANKAGAYAIEGFATSTVSANGSTDLSFAVLEPSIPGAAALSPVLTALNPFGDTLRSDGTGYVEMTNDGYSTDTFSITSRGVFGISDAVATNHRSLMIYDVESGIGCFTFLYQQLQKKDGEHIFTIVFRKTWDRDL